MPSEVGFFRRHLRLQPDLAQRPPGLRATGEFSRLAERGQEVVLDIQPPHHFHQPPQAFAGHQHQVVAGLVDKTLDPGLDRCFVRRVVDGEHRASQDVGTLLGEQPGELRFLARFQNQNAIAVQSAAHDLAVN